LSHLGYFDHISGHWLLLMDLNGNVVLLYSLHGSDVVSHLPCRNTLLIHLIQLTRITLRGLRDKEIGCKGGKDPCTQEQEGWTVAPVRAIDID
jgi:hypothetical protein